MRFRRLKQVLRVARSVPRIVVGVAIYWVARRMGVER